VKDWNVVVSIYQDGFRRALHALHKLGEVDRSPYYNLLVMSADDPVKLLAAIEQATAESPALYDAISRVAPAMRTFEFHSPQEFRDNAGAILQEWAGRLAGRSFHARLHRRGRHADLPGPETEMMLDELVLMQTKAAGEPARIAFTDPDAVIVVDTVDERAGVSLWTREDLAVHGLLKPD